MALLLPPQQSTFDAAGNRALDARLFVYQAGTTTPVPVFLDAALTTRHPMPIPAKGNGILPLVYVPPGSYRLRFEDPWGYVYDQVEDLTIEGTTSGGGGGGDVDTLRLFQTGDIKDRYGTGTHPGWCRLNGRTIGSAASAGSERANDDAHDLFVFLWNADPNLAVAGGRGPNAETDWVSAKTIALPDQAGRARFGLDDQGAGAKGRLNGGLFAFGFPHILGSYGGEAYHIQAPEEMASHGHGVTATMDMAGGHDHTGSTSYFAGGRLGITYNRFQPQYGTGDPQNTVNLVGGGSGNAVGQTEPGLDHGHTFTTTFGGLHAHNISATVALTGSSFSMNWLPPFLLVSNYIKL